MKEKKSFFSNSNFDNSVEQLSLTKALNTIPFCIKLRQVNEIIYLPVILKSISGPCYFIESYL